MNEGKNDRPPLPETAAGKQYRKGCLIILLTAAVLFLTAVMLISGRPCRWQVPPEISRQEAAHLQEIIRKLTSVMVTEDGKMAENAVIELSPPEINALLTNGLRVAQTRQTPDLYYDAEWEKGILRIRISRLLFFLAVNLEAELIPAIRNGRIEAQVHSCRLGRLPVSPELVRRGLKHVLRKYENRVEIQTLLEIVTELAVKGDSIRLRMQPKKINRLLPLLLNPATGKF